MAIASAFRSLAELAAKKAPYDDALALAQRRAALPVSEGGLGLPAGNTPMDRAGAMGFDTTVYHATTNDFNAFDLSRAGSATTMTPTEKAVFMTSNPSAANEFIAGPYYKSGNDVVRHYAEGAQVMPLRASLKPEVWEMAGGMYRAPFVEGAIKEAKDAGADAVVFKNMRDPGFSTSGRPPLSHVVAGLEPKNIRSRFAAFDPFRKNESYLLAGIAPYAAPAAAVGLAGAAMAPQDAEAGIAGQLSKTADLAALKIAQKAESGGLPMAKIYDATGWAKGADGKWRWEFDDSGAKLTHNPNMLERLNKQGKPFVLDDLGNTLPHKNLYNAYPDATGVQVQHNLGGVPSGGSYNQASDRITLEGSTLGHATGEAKSTLMHETQHAIQQREGFARGGSPDAVGYDDAETARLAAQLRETQQRYMQAKNTGQDPYGIESSPDAVKNELDRAKQEWEAHKKTMQAMREGGPQEAYRRLAGEVEARNVQTRMGMTPDDRRMRPFWQTEDVPRADQIVQGNSGTSPYAEMQALKRAASNQARTHAAPRVPGTAEMAGRSMLQEVANPLNWLGLRMAALAYPREMGDPQALNYADPYYSYSGSRR